MFPLMAKSVFSEQSFAKLRLMCSQNQGWMYSGKPSVISADQQKVSILCDLYRKGAYAGKAYPSLVGNKKILRIREKGEVRFRGFERAVWKLERKELFFKLEQENRFEPGEYRVCSLQYGEPVLRLQFREDRTRCILQKVKELP